MKRTTLLLLVITLCAFILRVYRLDFIPLRGDEAFTVIFVQRTWEGLWKGIRLIEPNPPLMYLLLRVWVAIAGTSEFVTRYFSAFFGVLCVPLLYRFARELLARNPFSDALAARPRVAPTVVSPREPRSQVPDRSPARAGVWGCPPSSSPPLFPNGEEGAGGDGAVRGQLPSGDNPLNPKRDRRIQIETAAPVLAAALIAINPYQIWHSQDIRNYTMWPALSLLSLVAFWRWMNRESTVDSQQSESIVQHPTSNIQFLVSDLQSAICNLKSPATLLYVVFTAASLYTHYYDTFILVAENLFVFGLTLLYRRWQMLARWITLQMALAAVYLPWVFFGTDRPGTYGEASAEQSVPLWEQFRRTLSAFALGDTVPEGIKTVLWFPLALLAVGALIYWMRHHGASTAFLALYLGIPTLAVYAISIARPLFLERYLNGIAPAYYLLLAMGLERIVRWRWLLPGWLARPAAARLAALAPGVLGLLFFGATAAYALANHYFDPAYAKAPDWRSLTRFIIARQQPGDFVIQNYTEMSVIYYMNGALPVMTLPKGYWAEPADEQRLQELNAQYRRLWFVPVAPDFWDPDQMVENFLSRYDDRRVDARFTGLRLQLYATPQEFQKQIIPVNARVGDATLVGYRVEKTQPLHVVLYWRPARVIAQDYAVFVHLADAADRVRGQQDRAPVGGAYPTRAWQPGELIVDAYDLPAETEPGDYSIFVGMYDPATHARVPAYDSNGIPLPNDRVLLTQVTIP